MGGLTISFPQFKNLIKEVYDNTFDSIKKYSYPNKIYNKKLNKPIKAKYAMIEGWENKWKKGENRGFFIELKIPPHLKELIIYVRGVLVYKNGKKSYLPESSKVQDQQDFPVKKIVVPLLRKSKRGSSSGSNKPDGEKNKHVKIGTGFFVNSRNVVTNWHVIEGCKDIRLFRNGFKSRAYIINYDAINDLAVLNSDEKNPNYLKFRANRKLEIGEDIIAMGYPLGDILGQSIKLTKGNISTLTGIANDASKLQFTAPVQHGNSGGPLIDNRGAVIGVVYAGLDNTITQNVNLGIKAGTVKMFLNSSDINFKINKNSIKKEVVDIGREAKGAIVEVICKD